MTRIGIVRMMKSDTIAAIASGLTQSGIGIIRISGPDALAVADRIFRTEKNKLSERKTHTVNYGFIYNDEERLDEGLALIMRAPHSFTAEDVVEIQCHGGPLVMKRILESVISHGARLAEPGEFTKRAFLNGRIDLSQAEAVMDIIEAENDFALDASVSQLSGKLSGKIKEIRDKLIFEIASIEAALDDPEHLSLENYPEHLGEILTGLIEEIDGLLATADNGKKISEGIHTVILGRPNAGKSSLLNQLAGEERAIVTDIAGTTRDTLEETIRMDGFSLRLIDTAGIRRTDDTVEKIGVERAKSQAEKADLLIYVVDSSQSLDENDKDILELLRGRKAIILMNKSDLETVIDPEKLEEMTGQPVIQISAKEGQGLDQLKKEIEKLFDIGEIGKDNQIAITNLRHKEALADAESALKMAMESVEAGMQEDFYTIDLMAAYEALGRIIGQAVDDDLVNEIFAKFCMGK